MWSKIAVFIIFMGIVAATTYPIAELPEKAEDISPLLYGETIPAVSVKNLQGQEVSLNEVIAKKPTILIFYRGGWCPFCNRQLAGVQAMQEDFIQMGYQIVAISPDTPEKLNQTLDKNSLTYTLLSDNSMAVCKALGIAFQMPDEVATRYNSKGISLGGENKNLLPVPTVMVLDKAGKIEFEYINPNYRERLDPNLLKYAAKLALEKE